MRDGNKVLIVDDDELLVDMLVEQLKLHELYDCTVATSGAEGLKLAEERSFDIVILDVGLPDIEGHQVCRLLRRNGTICPIIMLTASESDSDVILALDVGANDYILKPFKIGILLARLRAHLRQHERSDDAIYTIGPYVFTPATRLLVSQKDDRRIRLTDKETAIIKHLYRAGEQPISRDALLNEVWGYGANVTTHTVETHIYRLRQKIEDDPSEAMILVTEGGGYKLVP